MHGKSFQRRAFDHVERAEKSASNGPSFGDVSFGHGTKAVHHLREVPDRGHSVYHCQSLGLVGRIGLTIPNPTTTDEN
jgi:hypothetical protein